MSCGFWYDHIQFFCSCICHRSSPATSTFKCNYFEVSHSRLLYHAGAVQSVLHCSGTEMLQRSMTCPFCVLCHNKIETPFKVNFRIFFVVRSNLVALKGCETPTPGQSNALLDVCDVNCNVLKPHCKATDSFQIPLSIWICRLKTVWILIRR